MKKTNPKIFIAYDDLIKEEEKHLEMMGVLCKTFGNQVGVKVNLDYVLQKGFGTIPRLPLSESSLFVDLKIWNGSRTMGDVFNELYKFGVDYSNVYSLADTEIKKALEKDHPQILGLTVLSHYTDAYCQKFFGKNLNETTKLLAQTAVENGCSGIILPGTTLEAVAEIDSSIIRVVPGIRPSWYEDKRHPQEIEPRMAIEKGATILVIGSPIMKSPDPIVATQRILDEIS